ncbi:lipid-binding SYLF domain-containing protein [Dokdonella soli]|uniref:Ysc84 actin-binding domain-containing protein n=1 Tax=Dokdonella soli TaxID=529810 RepID=A0ABN1IGU2_9GAMM
MHRAVFTLILALFATATLPAHAGEAEQKRAENALRVLKEVMEAPDKAIPKDLLQNAHAVAVIPDVIKAGFVVGGRHGEGLIAVKTRDGTWSNPSFVGLTGGSIGFQAGVSSTDVILVFRTERGVDSIVHGKFTLGADASAAAGPVGRSAQASTDAQLKAEIYSYSRARGLFAGAALDGTAITIDNSANQAVYGDGVTARRIFDGGVRNVPNAVVDFRDRLEEYTTK